MKDSFALQIQTVGHAITVPPIGRLIVTILDSGTFIY